MNVVTESLANPVQYTIQNLIKPQICTRTMSPNEEQKTRHIHVSLSAKWGKERIEISRLEPETKICTVKDIIFEKTNVLPKRQKLIGLTTNDKRKVTDDVSLSELKLKPNNTQTKEDGTIEIKHSFILMGTPEEQIFVDPSVHDDLPEVVDDFELNFNAGSDEWFAHVAKDANLKKFTEMTEIHIMNEPRPNKPLMVLDLDHTLLDFNRKKIEQASHADAIADTSSHSIGSSTHSVIQQMKRPFMDEFLSSVYKYYDLCVWSQTSWRWLETKLIELGMLTNPNYKFIFVLDKTSMFQIESTKKSTGEKVKHHVKPLQIIWSKFPNVWSPTNTVHLDDLSRNFALNVENGLKVSAYYQKRNKGKSRDSELLGLATYLINLAEESNDFTKVNFNQWMDVVAGKLNFIDTIKNDKKR
jgi:ubiquitin-like domain-containing CTD phosphatase 1